MLIICAFSFLPRPRVARAPRMMAGKGAGSAAGGGGDLAGGGDEERNAQLASLRKMFDTPSTDGAASTEKEDARALGMFLDMPLCRFSWCILPAQQVTLNIWQPQYTLMFQSLLAEPGPHYYFHVLLPGGADSLGKEGYELRPGTKSSLVGTLMRVSFAQREQDSRLTLVVQGLARGVVLRPTQDLPYSRGDVLLLPDAEALRDAARAAAVRLRPLPSADALFSSTRRRMVAAAAVGDAEHHWPYEATQLAVDGNGLSPLCAFNASAATSLGAAAAAAVDAALARTPMPPADDGDGLDADELLGAKALTALDAAVDAVAEEGDDDGGEAAAETAAALERLEQQVWVETDELLRILQRGAAAAGVGRDVPVPSQLLGLLPPPPDGGWPEGFKLAAADERLRARYAAAAAEEGPPGAMRATAYVPADAAYPARRRAERLSYAIWTIVGNQKVGVNAQGGSPLQAVLEVDETADRLRMVLRRLREVKGQLGGK